MKPGTLILSALIQLRCSQCGYVTRPLVSKEISEAAVRQLASDEGWDLTKVLCSGCADKEEKVVGNNEG